MMPLKAFVALTALMAPSLTALMAPSLQALEALTARKAMTVLKAGALALLEVLRSQSRMATTTTMPTSVSVCQLSSSEEGCPVAQSSRESRAPARGSVSAVTELLLLDW
jgi:hypothetical protein